MAAVTQPFILGQFFVYVNPGLSTIQQGEIIDSFRSIREDIEKTAYTAYLVELTEKLLDEKQPDPFLYDELIHTLKRIADYEDYAVPVMMYELKAFNKGGFQPILYSCTRCGDKQGPFTFSIGEGGLLCRPCSSLDEQSIPLTMVQVKLLQIFHSVSIEKVGEISVKPDNVRLLRQILDAYYDHYGGFYLKSKKFLIQLDQLKGL